MQRPRMRNSLRDNAIASRWLARYALITSAAVAWPGLNAVSQEADVARSRVQAYVNDGTRPQPETIAKLKDALEMPGRRKRP